MDLSGTFEQFVERALLLNGPPFTVGKVREDLYNPQASVDVEFGSPMLLSACTISATGPISGHTRLVSSVADPPMMSVRVAATPESRHDMAVTLESLHNMAGTPKTCHNMVASPAVIDTTPVFLAVMHFASEATRAIPRRLRLASSLADVNASGWHPGVLCAFKPSGLRTLKCGASALSSLAASALPAPEFVPLFMALPVMALTIYVSGLHTHFLILPKRLCLHQIFPRRWRPPALPAPPWPPALPAPPWSLASPQSSVPFPLHGPGPQFLALFRLHSASWTFVLFFLSGASGSPFLGERLCYKFPLSVHGVLVCSSVSFYCFLVPSCSPAALIVCCHGRSLDHTHLLFNYHGYSLVH